MTAAPRANRAHISSVLYLDIVGFSTISVAAQFRLKNHLNEVIAQSLEQSPEDDRVMLDTGDGAAICFIGDPEDALLAGLDILHAVVEYDDPSVADSDIADDRRATYRRSSEERTAGGSGSHALELRLGINLGPIRMVHDVNGRVNVLGDGINDAQRIMSFAEPGQILVSRSYFEVVSRLSRHHADMFKYSGVRQDKHVREHSLYQVVAPKTGVADSPDVPYDLPEGLVADAQLALVDLIGPVSRALVRMGAKSATSEAGFVEALAEVVPEGAERDAFRAGLSRWIGTAVVVELGDEPEIKPQEPATLLLVTQHLAGFVGPIARVLVERASQQARSLPALYEALAEELGTEEDRTAFLQMGRQ